MNKIEIATGLTGRGNKLHFSHNGLAVCNQGYMNAGYAIHSVQSKGLWSDGPLAIFEEGLQKSNLQPCGRCEKYLAYLKQEVVA